MANDECDYWGMTYNPEGIIKDEINHLYEDNSPHVQSFFLGFRPQVFNSDIFEKFINGIKQEKKCLFMIILENL